MRIPAKKPLRPVGKSLRGGHGKGPVDPVDDVLLTLSKGFPLIPKPVLGVVCWDRGNVFGPSNLYVNVRLHERVPRRRMVPVDLTYDMGRWRDMATFPIARIRDADVRWVSSRGFDRMDRYAGQAGLPAAEVKRWKGFLKRLVAAEVLPREGSAQARYGLLPQEESGMFYLAIPASILRISERFQNLTAARDQYDSLQREFAYLFPQASQSGEITWDVPERVGVPLRLRMGLNRRERQGIMRWVTGSPSLQGVIREDSHGGAITFEAESEKMSVCVKHLVALLAESRWKGSRRRPALRHVTASRA